MRVCMALRTTLAVILIGFLGGCSKKSTTPAGPLGEVDLSSRLPPGITVPANTTSHEATQTVCPGGEGDDPVPVRVRWKSFSKDGGTYISWYAVDLEKAVSGVTVRLDGPAKVYGDNATPGGAFRMTVGINLRCTRAPSGQVTFEEPDTVSITPDGKSSVRSK